MKKNRQYYKSRKRLLSQERKISDNVFAAIRIANEVIMSAMQIRIAMQTPVPKFQSGGIQYSELGGEIVLRDKEKIQGDEFLALATHYKIPDTINRVCTDDPLKGAKLLLVPDEVNEAIFGKSRLEDFSKVIRNIKMAGNVRL